MTRSSLRKTNQNSKKRRISFSPKLQESTKSTLTSKTRRVFKSDEAKLTKRMKSSIEMCKRYRRETDLKTHWEKNLTVFHKSLTKHFNQLVELESIQDKTGSDTYKMKELQRHIRKNSQMLQFIQNQVSSCAHMNGWVSPAVDLIIPNISS